MTLIRYPYRCYPRQFAQITMSHYWWGLQKQPQTHMIMKTSSLLIRCSFLMLMNTTIPRRPPVSRIECFKYPHTLIKLILCTVWPLATLYGSKF